MKTLIVYNPKSGKGKFKNYIDRLIMALKEMNINEVSVFSSDRPKEITDFLLLNAYKFEIMILSGGDGTLNETVNALMKVRKKPKILYIPSGTVNDVGRMLRLSKDPLIAIELLQEKPVKMDVVQINNNYFIYAAAFGKFSSVSYGTKHQRIKKNLGKFYYYLRSIKNLFLSFDFKVNKENRAYLVLLLKTNSLGSFKLHLKKQLKLNNGKLSVLVFKKKSFLSFIHFIFFMLLGQHYPFGRKEIETSTHEIKLDIPQVLNIDGEIAEENKEFKIEVHQEAIEFFVEKNIKKLYFE